MHHARPSRSFCLTMLDQGVERELDRYPRVEYDDLPAISEDGVTSLRFEEGHDGLLPRVPDHLPLAEHARGGGGDAGHHGLTAGEGDDAPDGRRGGQLRLRHCMYFILFYMIPFILLCWD